MQDKWYGDNKDLVKWSVLFHLAKTYDCDVILQVAYYRPSDFDLVTIGEENLHLPQEVIRHFRNIRNIERIDSNIQVRVFADLFEDRAAYLKKAIEFISRFSSGRHVVFLDPDTGLEPKSPDPKHVLDGEARDIWKALRTGDIFVFYQHQTNRKGQPWIETKRQQLANALSISVGEVKVAHRKDIAPDVVFYFAQKD